MKIAFFDSGIGGLSVLYQARLMLPHGEFIFYADKDNVPYGVKSPDEVRRFVADAFDFLTAQGAGAIVVACNTATSVAVRDMRERYKLPIIGMEPAVKKALDTDASRRVLVAATPITVRGSKMQSLLAKVDKHHLIDLLPLPKLVEFAEGLEFDSPAVREYLSDELAAYDLAQYSALVLGCTHFNYFKDILRKILPLPVRLIDGNKGTVRELMRHLPAESATVGEGTTTYYYSGRPVTGAAELKRLQICRERLAAMYEIT